MATEIDALELRVSENTTEATRGIDELAASLGKLKNACKGGLGLTSVANQTKKVGEALGGVNYSAVQKLESLASALTRLGNIDGLKNISRISKQISKLSGAMDGISLSSVQNLESTTSALERLNALEGFRTPNIRSLTDNVGTPTPPDTTSSDVSTEAENTAQSVTDASDAVNQYTDVVSRSRMAMDALRNALAAARERFVAFRVVSTIFHGVTSAVQTTANAVVNLASAAKKGVSAVYGLGSKLKSAFDSTTLGKNLNGLNTKLGGILRSFARIAGYRAIRFFFSQLTKMLKEGINNLYLYSRALGGTFADSLDRLATSFQYLKNSLGAMVSPLINAIAPAVDYLIDKFVTLLNVVNQFFARLSGASVFTQAKKQATTYYEAAGLAKKASKKMKEATLGIDELNIIKENDNDSSGGGGGGNPAEMFETVPIAEDIKDFTDKLKGLFNAGDWKGLGNLLGNKFNELVDSIDWDGLGHKFGYYFDGAIKTLYYTIKAMDFRNLGKHIAEFLNAAMSEVDFTFLGRLSQIWKTKILDFVIGVFGELNWGLVGKSIGDFMRGVFDEWYDFFVKYDWGQMADAAYQGLKDFLLGIDFESLAKSVFKSLGAGFGAAVSFVGTFFADVWKDLSEYFSGKIEECGGDIVEGLLTGIVDGIKGIGKWIKENIFDPFVEGFKATFGIHSPAETMLPLGKAIVEGVWEGIKAAIGGGIAIIKDWAGKVVEWFIKGEDGKGIVEHFKEIGGNIVGGFKDKVGSTYNTVKTNVSTWASKVKDWFSNSSFGGVNGDTFSKFANNTIEGFKTKIGSAYTNVKSNVMTWATKAKEWFTSSSFGGVNNENFQKFANETIEGFKNKIGSAYVNTKSNVTTWATNVKGWFTGIANNPVFAGFANDVIEGFKAKIGSAYVNSRSNMQTWATNVKSWFNGIASKSAFSGFAMDVINGFKEKIGSAYTTVQSSISTWATNVKNWFSGIASKSAFAGFATDVINGFKDKINSAYSTVQSAITTWATNVKNWFNGIASSSAFAGFANDVINGFKGAISSGYSSVQSTMTTWANSVVTWFKGSGTGSLVTKFTTIGSDLIQGFINGVNSLWDTAMATIKNFGESVIKKGKEGTKEKSPSRAFREIGAYVVEGFNLGISDMMGSSFKIMDTWTSGITSYQPRVGFALDTSALDYYNSDSFRKSINTQASVSNQFTSYGFVEGMEEFYKEYVEPTLVGMASDVKRQADKDEQTIVKIGNRTITDAVKEQRNANGFSFTTA